MQHTQFSLEGSPHIDLNQLLKASGLCGSGGEAKQLIAAGQVSVNGAAELRRRCKIRAGQTVELNDFKISVLA